MYYKTCAETREGFYLMCDDARIMAPKKRLRMRGVKHTSKRLEDELLERSRTLAENPGLIRPACAGNCRKCVFDKPFKAIDGLRGIRNNPDALIKEASRFGGDDIVRAYAGTISLTAAGSVPLLATATLGTEKISYAVRGTVKADKLIGCQYYDDPRIRMLLYNEVIRKNKLHLYSFGENIVCSDKPNMPEDFLYDAFWETPYEFPEDSLDCGHETSAVLEIEVKSLGEKIRICDGCAKDVSTLSFIAARLAAVDPLDDISVRVRHKYHKPGEKDYEDVTGDQLKKYMFGALTDKALISTVKRAKMGDFKEGSAAYVIGNRNYGDSLDDFMSALEGEDNELKTLRRFLEENPRAIVLRAPRAIEALNTVWEADWKTIVTIHTDAKTADAIGDVSKTHPSTALKNAYDRFIMADIAEALPEFKKPGPVTATADRLAKAYKVGGQKMILESIQKNSFKDSKSRIVGAAFLMATGMGDMPFKLTDSEREFAEYLKPFAKNVADASAQGYVDAMRTLLTASGCGEKV